MSNIVKIENKDDLNLILSIFKDKPNFMALMEGLAESSNKLQDCLIEIRDNYWLDTAEGVQLDVIGSIHNETRYGKSDSDYRTAIKLKIRRNYNSGTPEEIIEVLKNVYNATSVRLKNLGNGNLEITTDILLTKSEFNEFLQSLPAGVGLNFKSTDGTPFVFFGDLDGEGFGKLKTETATFSDDSVIEFSDDSIVEFITNESDTTSGGSLVGLWTTL